MDSILHGVGRFLVRTSRVIAGTALVAGIVALIALYRGQEIVWKVCAVLALISLVYGTVAQLLVEGIYAYLKKRSATASNRRPS